MELNMHILFSACIIFYAQYDFSSVDALIGPNIRPAERLEFPFIVSLIRMNRMVTESLNDHICTATLITSIHVLSAAQCIENRLKNETVVLAGTNHLFFGRLYSISWWINYNSWAQFLSKRIEFDDNDISIIKLTRDVDEDITPGPILYLAGKDLYGFDVHFAGWGETNNHQISSYMLTASASVITSSECEHRIAMLEGGIIPIPDNLICTLGDPFVLLQRGDFGGPVLLMGSIVGVGKETRPFINDNFHPEKVNVHLNINYYKHFIQDVIKPTFIWA